MPLFVEGQELKQDDDALESLEGFLQKYEATFHEQNEKLKKQNVQTVTPDYSFLFVDQRELACVGSSSNVVRGLGTDMMTTCHAVALRCTRSGATSFGHFDGASTEDGVQDMVASLCMASRHKAGAGGPPASATFDLHMVGGFGDDRNLSEWLTMDLLNAFSSVQADSCENLTINLKTFFCTTLNEKIVHKYGNNIKSPILFGLGVTMATGEIFPAVFDDAAKEPVSTLRGAKSLHGPAVMNQIYDWQNDEIVINPFTYDEFPSASVWLDQPDSMIRKHMSTSPEVEPDNFERRIRDSLRFILAHPDPMLSVFAGGALRFQWKDSRWMQVTQALHDPHTAECVEIESSSNLGKS